MSPMRLSGLGALGATLALNAAAEVESWNCRNTDLEVSCAETCTVASAHTPMDIHVSASQMSVCAYSGCWEGAPSLVHKAGSIVTFVGTDLRWTGVTPDSATIAISLDQDATAATVLVPGLYATPATCTQITE